jgi:hypothetical protein
MPLPEILFKNILVLENLFLDSIEVSFIDNESKPHSVRLVVIFTRAVHTVILNFNLDRLVPIFDHLFEGFNPSRGKNTFQMLARVQVIISLFQVVPVIYWKVFSLNLVGTFFVPQELVVHIFPLLSEPEFFLPATGTRLREVE